MIVGRPIGGGEIEDLAALDNWYSELHEALMNMIPAGPQRDQAINRLTESQMWAELAKIDGNPLKK